MTEPTKVHITISSYDLEQKDELFRNVNEFHSELNKEINDFLRTYREQNMSYILTMPYPTVSRNTEVK